ncbi:hypothetical protein ACSMX9_18005 [Streptomyces sp. LE64]|uniref:hypothetical protein n=1 Tax=Streptomyces sp. LE64 TaxID=3448653 RepID=UPI0040437D9E
MMPGTVPVEHVGLPLVAPVAGLDVFGSPGVGEPVRVAVQVNARLSFAELLGLLVHHGSLTVEELGEDAAVLECLQFEVLSTDLWAMERQAEKAMAVLASGRDDEYGRFVRAVAVAVTRVFGVSA